MLASFCRILTIFAASHSSSMSKSHKRSVSLNERAPTNAYQAFALKHDATGLTKCNCWNLNSINSKGLKEARVAT